MHRPARPRRAFTLIEMLVVIAIIAMLIALLFPAISKAIANAERAKAQATVTGLSIAFKAYFTEYGRWPGAAAETGQTVTTNLVAGGGYNPRNIVFFDYQTKDLSGNILLNPWKTNYFVAFDSNYDGGCTGPTNTLSVDVAVWTRDGTTTKTNYITSW